MVDATSFRARSSSGQSIGLRSRRPARKPPRSTRTVTAEQAARRLYRAARLVGMSPAAARAEVASALLEGVRQAQAVRAGGVS